MHLYYCQRNKRMKHPLTMAFAVGAFGACFGPVGPAQASRSGRAMNQSLGVTNQGRYSSQYLLVGFREYHHPEQPRATSRPQISVRNIVWLRGRGLPGMPGGPPIKAPMGAQDPSTSYMRPPVIGPLFCDPSINIAC